LACVGGKFSWSNKDMGSARRGAEEGREEAIGSECNQRGMRDAAVLARCN